MCQNSDFVGNFCQCTRPSQSLGVCPGPTLPNISIAMRCLILFSLSSLFGTFVCAAEKTIDRRGVEFFEKRIRPVLTERCYQCHSAKSDEVGGNLLLDTREGARKGGEMGPAVVPTNLKESLLIEAIEYNSVEMPPDKKLPANVIEDFKHWIKIGAPDPRGGKMSRTAKTSQRESNAGQRLWSLDPLAAAKPPEVSDPNWPRTDIDRFVLAKLEEMGLQPVADSDPFTLLRRLSFDLAGLPPTSEHIDRVLSDSSTSTFEAIIDELIDSPQFGERWARHWLDVARFAESAGSSRDVLMPYAWKYRDYVIDAFNADLPYPQFITEQIAGDLLPAEDADERERLQVATGFLAVGQKSLNGGNVELDIVDDQIDVVGKAVLGLTVSCARCHDHKFDPIPTRDYYSLAGIFLSTETLYGGGTKRPKSNTDKAKLYLTLSEGVSLEKLADVNKQLAKLNKDRQSATKRIQALTKKLPKDWKAQKKRLERREAADDDATPLSKKEQSLLKQIADLETTQDSLKQVQQQVREVTEKKKAIPPPDFAVGVREAKQIADTKIRIRGERNQQGEIAPRGFLECIGLDEEKTLGKAKLDRIDKTQSGRRQLAAWLTAAENPLTARVAANRVWLHLFGRGIVPTADNFGLSGQPPTHPELLDYLANRFVANGWSTKKLVREIVLSRAYQLSSNFDESNYSKDPGNKFCWRMSRRRLEAEAIRDAMMSASGELNLERPPFGSAVAQIGEGEVGRNLNTKPLREPFPYRSVYLPIIRGILPESLSLFDYPDPSNPQSVRDATNVPAQSLYFMNSPFVIRQAVNTAKRITDEQTERAGRIRAAYRLILGRLPAKEEWNRINAFLDSVLHGESAAPDKLTSAWTTVCQSLFATAEFRYLN